LHGKNETRTTLSRNFLHAADLRLNHPRSGEALSFSRPLPQELIEFLKMVTGV
jgi:23S rRNA-/tRNA-specific pseudouridylate synthase